LRCWPAGGINLRTKRGGWLDPANTFRVAFEINHIIAKKHGGAMRVAVSIRAVAVFRQQGVGLVGFRFRVTTQKFGYPTLRTIKLCCPRSGSAAAAWFGI
jgi:hypothetical protein